MIPNLRLLLVTYGLLVALVLTTTLGAWRPPATLAVAGLEMMLIALGFMKLRHDPKTIWWVASAAVLLVALGVTLLFVDYVTLARAPELIRPG